MCGKGLATIDVILTLSNPHWLRQQIKSFPVDGNDLNNFHSQYHVCRWSPWKLEAHLAGNHILFFSFDVFGPGKPGD